MENRKNNEKDAKQTECNREGTKTKTGYLLAKGTRLESSTAHSLMATPTMTSPCGEWKTLKTALRRTVETVKVLLSAV